MATSPEEKKWNKRQRKLDMTDNGVIEKTKPSSPIILNFPEHTLKCTICGETTYFNDSFITKELETLKQAFTERHHKCYLRYHNKKGKHQ